MTALQEQAARLVTNIPDKDLNLLMGLFLRLSPLAEAAPSEKAAEKDIEMRKQAFQELESMRIDLKKRLPISFDAEKEYIESVDEKYGNTH